MMRLIHVSMPRIGWRWWLTIGVIVLLTGFRGYWWWQQRPARIRFGSVGARSLSVAWISREPSVGCVTMVGIGFPVDKRTICSNNQSLHTHLTQINKLQPKTRYLFYWTTNGLLDPSSFRLLRTRTELEKPRLPVAVMGTIVNSKWIPISGALVLIWPVSYTADYPEIAITNEEGNWTADVGSFNEGVTRLIIESGTKVGNWTSQLVETNHGLVPPLEVQP